MDAAKVATYINKVGRHGTANGNDSGSSVSSGSGSEIINGSETESVISVSDILRYISYIQCSDNSIVIDDTGMMEAWERALQPNGTQMTAAAATNKDSSGTINSNVEREIQRALGNSLGGDPRGGLSHPAVTRHLQDDSDSDDEVYDMQPLDVSTFRTISHRVTLMDIAAAYQLSFERRIRVILQVCLYAGPVMSIDHIERCILDSMNQMEIVVSDDKKTRGISIAPSSAMVNISNTTDLTTSMSTNEMNALKHPEGFLSSAGKNIVRLQHDDNDDSSDSGTVISIATAAELMSKTGQGAVRNGRQAQVETFVDTFRSNYIIPSLAPHLDTSLLAAGMSYVSSGKFPICPQTSVSLFDGPSLTSFLSLSLSLSLSIYIYIYLHSNLHILSSLQRSSTTGSLLAVSCLLRLSVKTIRQY